MTRRFFIKLAASALAGATAVRILPVSVLPVEGAVHEELRLRAIDKLRAAYIEYVKDPQNSIRYFKVGPAIFSQYEDEIMDVARILYRTEDIDREDTLAFKGYIVRSDPSLAPWQVEVYGERMPTMRDAYEAAKRGERWQ